MRKRYEVQKGPSRSSPNGVRKGHDLVVQKLASNQHQLADSRRNQKEKRGHTGVIYGLHGDNGRDDGNYDLGFNFISCLSQSKAETLNPIVPLK